MLHCQHCKQPILNGQPYKFVKVGIETQDHGLATIKSADILQTCCMTCDFEDQFRGPKFGCDKPTAMDDWSAETTSDNLYFEFISAQREKDLHQKLEKVNVLHHHWWSYLTGAEQHILAKAFDLSL